MTAYAQNFEKYRLFLNKAVRYDLRKFGLPLEARIADIGAAFGEDIRRLNALGYRNVVGVEPDAYCIQNRGDLDIRQGTLEETGLETGAFDAVLVDNVFHHISDYKRGLREVHRILRPGGTYCFLEPRPSQWRRVMDWVTFETPVPKILGGPFMLRYHVMGEEIATGLYPQWLRESGRFFDTLEELFEVTWLRKKAVPYIGKARKRGGVKPADS